MTAGIGRKRHEERGVERALKAGIGSHLGQVVLAVGALDMSTKGALAGREQRREVQQVRLPVALDLNLTQALGVAHHLLNGTEAQASHCLLYTSRCV